MGLCYWAWDPVTKGQDVPTTGCTPATSSFFFEAKKDGGLRSCNDYRTLNQNTKYRYPHPRVPSSLKMMMGATIFSKLNLRSMYNLIHIQNGDEWNTTFITPADHYEYMVMPYCLSNLLSVFQGFMNEVFQNYLHRFMIVYIYDIMIYLQKKVDHRLHVVQVIQWLWENHLYLKLEKCEFHQSNPSTCPDILIFFSCL